MKSAGLNLLNKMIIAQDSKEYYALKLKDSYFVESELEYFDFIEKHIHAYGQLPSIQIYSEAMEMSLPVLPETVDYYVDQIQSRYMKKGIQTTLTDLEKIFAHPVAPSSKEIIHKISEMVLDFNVNLKHKNLFDFKEAEEIVLKAYLEKQLQPSGGLKMGWPSFDDISGGLNGGDIVSLIGRPGAGKSYVLLKIAHYMWKHQKMTPLFLTMEMSHIAMFNRLTAIETGLTINHINKGELSTKAFNKMHGMMIDMKDHDTSFWLLDGGSTTTVDELALACHQLKPDVIFVDGAYLLRHRNKRLDRWARMAENADLLKFNIARDFDIPVILSYQFNKDAVKKKSKGQKLGLEDIYGSDVIAQISSIVLGLLQEDDIETSQKRRLDILKGREGEIGDFLIKWDFQYMNFEEIMAQDGEKINYF